MDKYNQKYSVNGNLIFSANIEQLNLIFEDFPKNGELIELVVKINSLYMLFFLL